MLEVQKYLKTNSLQDLKNEFGIEINFHPNFPEIPLVILNYNQYISPKTNPIVMECRGLVLDIIKNEVVALPMKRFFNEGEAYELTKNFDWNNFEGRDKEDGSLVMVFRWNNQSFITTRGSWGNSICGSSGKTWVELVKNVFGEDRWNLFNSGKMIKEGSTLIFEFCSIYNKVVRHYKTSRLFLLAITDSKNYIDHNSEIVDFFAENWNFERPQKYIFNSIEEVKEVISAKSSEDPTWEGLVLRDKNGLRIKVKSSLYVSLHHLRGNGSICHPKNLVSFILKNEEDEVLAYFPEIENNVTDVKEKINGLWKESLYYFDLVNKNSDVDQKKFALIVKDCRLSKILFYLKKDDRLTLQDLEIEFKSNSELIYKILYR